jgi:SAM-dependent methyltransferase
MNPSAIESAAPPAPVGAVPGAPNETTLLRAHYQGLLEQYGPDHRAVQWSSGASQEARFSILSEYARAARTVVDVGSGLGDLLSHLRKNGYSGHYRGLELVPEFVALSTERHANDHQARFEVFDAIASPIPGAEVVVASGLFNNRLEDNWGFLVRVLGNMFQAATKAIVFNAMSSYVDYQDPHLYYVDPLALFDYAKRQLSRRVVLRHDYVVKANSMPFEFTLVIYKE